MALFDPGSPCPLCGTPIALEDDHIGFTFLDSRDPHVEILDDGVVHRRCLNLWVNRDAFVSAWNAEAAGCLGETHRLEITPAGEVQYKSERGSPCT
jgi:hypothetical protein